jgi:hypothetical protein
MDDNAMECRKRRLLLLLLMRTAEVEMSGCVLLGPANRSRSSQQTDFQLEQLQN